MDGLEELDALQPWADRRSGIGPFFIGEPSVTQIQTDTAIQRAANAAPAPSIVAEPAGKIGILLSLMRREEGASIYDMAEATGWHIHSVRGALAGVIKKRLKIDVTSTKPGPHRIYKVAAAPAGQG